MSQRIEITDEMVAAAMAAEDKAWEVKGNWRKEAVRAALEAALNPPVAPEVEVTDAMMEAGFSAYRQGWRANGPVGECMTKVYRAMHAARPKALVPLLVCAKCGSYHVEEERRKPSGWVPPGRAGRRSGDLK